MLQLDCNREYSDILERALYNGLISGVSRDGRKFFYTNPLESIGRHHRQEWFGCSCCPPNVARLLASLGQYVYSQSNTDAIVHLYIQSTGKFCFGDSKISILQETDYPWDGNVNIHIDLDSPSEFVLKLRIPSWCHAPQVYLNENLIDIGSTMDKGYVRIERRWQKGDTVTLVMPMKVEKVFAHPKVRQNMRRIALQRGPLLYCLEDIDNETPIHLIAIPLNTEFHAELHKDLLDGVVVISGNALAMRASDWNSILYSTQAPSLESCKIKAIPYYAWDNRAPGAMLVWIPYLLP